MKYGAILLALITLPCFAAPGRMEIEAMKQSLCSEYGNKAEAIWRAKSSKKVRNFNNDYEFDREIASAVLSNDGYINSSKDAFMRGYAMCLDKIEEMKNQKLREKGLDP